MPENLSVMTVFSCKQTEPDLDAVQIQPRVCYRFDLADD